MARTTFRTGNRRGVSVEELRHTLSDSYWGAPARKLALSAQSEVPDEVVDRLASDLSQRLDEYIDASSGRIGHSFRVDGDLGGVVRHSPDYAVEVKSKSDLGGLAFALVRAAALVGSDSAARLRRYAVPNINFPTSEDEDCRNYYQRCLPEQTGT